MSDDIENTPATPEAPAAKVAKKRPAVRKSSKSPAKSSEDVAAPTAVAAPSSEPAAVPAPAPRAEEAIATAAASSPSAPTEGSPESSDGGRIASLVDTPAPEPGGGSKKRRRRKKKHGQGQGGQPSGQHPQAVSVPAEGPSGQAGVAASEPQQPHQPAMHAAPRPKLDPEEVAKKAWKIFQSEVGEEGLALIDDHDAREISRRCFRLAEIFLEEAARRAQR